MEKSTFALILFCLFTVVGFAQRPEGKEVKISGIVIDKETKQPLEYATIAFLVNVKTKLLPEE